MVECPIRGKDVDCDGLCKVVDSAGVTKMCLVLEKGLDVALNCH